jgi:hypothetical protein
LLTGESKCRKVVETRNKGNGTMNFQETEKLVQMINDVEFWAGSLYREINKEDTDLKRVESYKGWLAEAKDELFKVASK